MSEVHQQRDAAVGCYLVPPENIHLYWDSTYRPMIQEALDCSPVASDNVGDIHRRLMDGDAQLLQVATYDDLLAVAVLERVEGKGGDMLHVWTLTGERMGFWLRELVDYLEQLAASNECAGVTLTGRPGWERALRKFGFVKELVTMRMGANYERGR